MAKLTFLEKDYFENLFGLGSGYVINFSNREFQEFVFSVMSIDIYQKYVGLSKAKILRAIISEYSDIEVGKLFLEMMTYMQAKKMINEQNSETFRACARIANRLIGKLSDVPQPQEVVKEGHRPVVASFDFARYLQELQKLSDYPDSPQARGFAFEKYLKDYFEESELYPRGSFKIVGEQIDGSFLLHNEVYLLEAKWTSKPIDKGDLVIFNEKVSSKSGFTRGLYISYSGYSEEALKTFATGRTVNIVLMTVQELAILLSRNTDFKELLWGKIRALAEEGSFYKSVYEI